MSNLSELLPAGAGAKSADFVASGTLGSGITVGLNSDGTVTAIAGALGGMGSPTVFESASFTWTGSTFDSNANKVVIVYGDAGNSTYGTAVVGTVSGTSISFGTPVVFNSSRSDYNSATFDSNLNKVVIAYKDRGNASYGTAIVGTVSGTSISFGTSVVFESATTNYTKLTYDPIANKVVIIYGDGGNSSYGTAVVGTVSGTSISFGSPVVFETGSTSQIASTFDSDNNKVVIAYKDAGNSNYGTAVVGTVSGTSISFGSPAVFLTANTTSISIVYDTAANKIVIVYQDANNSSYGTAIVGTVSGTSISFGTSIVFEAASSSNMSATFDSTANKVVIAYKDQGNSTYGTLIVGTVSGTSISFGSATIFNTAVTGNITSTFDSNTGRVVIAYQDGGNSNYGTAIVYGVTTTNYTDFIGITDQAIADTATGAVIVQGGVSEKLSGLTVGADYYVQADGSLSSPTASEPYVIAGATYVQNFSVSAQDGDPTGIAFNVDGTKMFVVGESGNDVNEYTLSTGFDISTASYVRNFSVSAQDTQPYGLAFNTDGTKMFVVGQNGQDVNEYTLSTGFNVSTASFVDSFSVSGQEVIPTGLAFNTDGTKMFVTGRNSDNVNEYSLSAGFDVSTASYSQNFSIGGEEGNPYGLAFNTDGTKMFISGSSGQDVTEYLLSTGFDVSTASYSGASFSVAAQEVAPRNLTFSADGTKIFVTGAVGDSVFQYSTGAGSVTSVPAGRALSSTSILLEG